ncbi:MAG: hypothetical protein VXZ59_04955 [Cyanobacteriota bacterium]|nr:hypothetical protein [Cyanobacteriota bacterium]
MKHGELTVMAEACQFINKAFLGVPSVGMQEQARWQKQRLQMASIQMGMKRGETGLDDLHIKSDAAVALEKPSDGGF